MESWEAKAAIRLALARLRHAPRLHEGLEALTPHRSVYLKIRFLADSSELLEYEKICAVLNQAEPIALTHQMLFALAQVSLIHQIFGVCLESVAPGLADHFPEETVQLQRTVARAQVEDVRALYRLDTSELRIHAARPSLDARSA